MTDHKKDEDQAPRANYEVGYRRPPKKTQFKAGQSGNPKGRKRKPQSLQAQMQKAMSKKVRITEGGKTKSLPLQDVIIRTLVNQAAKGDLRTAAFVFKVLNNPEFAETEAFDQSKLSPGDQAMLDQVMAQFSEPESSDPAQPPGSTREDAAPVAPLPPPPPPTTLASAMPAPRNDAQTSEDDSDVE